jgi:GNAT superfamily N-acetyltransferase
MHTVYSLTLSRCLWLGWALYWCVFGRPRNVKAMRGRTIVRRPSRPRRTSSRPDGGHPISFWGRGRRNSFLRTPALPARRRLAPSGSDCSWPLAASSVSVMGPALRSAGNWKRHGDDQGGHRARLRAAPTRSSGIPIYTGLCLRIPADPLFALGRVAAWGGRARARHGGPVDEASASRERWIAVEQVRPWRYTAYAARVAALVALRAVEQRGWKGLCTSAGWCPEPPPPTGPLMLAAYERHPDAVKSSATERAPANGGWEARLRDESLAVESWCSARSKGLASSAPPASRSRRAEKKARHKATPVSGLYVAPEHRHKGIGHGLVRVRPSRMPEERSGVRLVPTSTSVTDGTPPRFALYGALRHSSRFRLRALAVAVGGRLTCHKLHIVVADLDRRGSGLNAFGAAGALRQHSWMATSTRCTR